MHKSPENPQKIAAKSPSALKKAPNPPIPHSEPQSLANNPNNPNKTIRHISLIRNIRHIRNVHRIRHISHIRHINHIYYVYLILMGRNLAHRGANFASSKTQFR